MASLRFGVRRKVVTGGCGTAHRSRSRASPALSRPRVRRGPFGSMLYRPDDGACERSDHAAEDYHLDDAQAQEAVHEVAQPQCATGTDGRKVAPVLPLLLP